MPIIKARSSSLINNVDLRGTPTAPTANAGTASTQIATTGFVGTAVTNLIDSAPGVLDTLNELAAAINDDASFATTVTNSIATKVALAGDTMTGFLTLHADPSSNLHAATKQYVDAATLAITINSTDDVPEGISNLYYTDSRVRSGISLTSDNTTVLDYDSATGAFSYNHPTSDGILEGVTNQYYTDARARAAVSLTSDDSTVLSYSSATGVFTFTKQDTDKTVEGSSNLYFTTARARNSISAGSNISYDSATGIISSSAAVDSVNGQTGVVVLDTDDIAEGSSNLYFTNGRAAAAISLTTNDQNMLAYNSGTGAFTFVKPSTDGISEGSSNLYFTDARARAAMSVSGDLTYNSTTGVVGFALADHDTGDLPEGTNLYFTDARARSAISLSSDDNNILAYNSGTGVLTFVTPTTDSIDEGTTNKYYTDTRVRNAISVDNDNSANPYGLGDSISYDASTGVITYTSPMISELRTIVSATDVSGDGSFTYNSATGVFTYTGPSAAETRAHFSVDDVSGDGSLAYNSATGVFTYTGPSAAEVRAHFSVDDVSGDGSLSYNSSTGVITYTGPSAAEVRAHISDGVGIAYNSSTGVIAVDFTEFDTDDITEGSNLYYTDARARASVSAGTGVSYDSSTGVISIGQAVGTSDSVTFGGVTINGNLTVTGTTTTVNTETIELADNIIVLNSNATGAATESAGIEVERGSDTNVSLLWDEAANKWTIGSETFVAGAVEATTVTATNFVGSFSGQVSDISNFDTDDLAEGAGNLYFTDARARNAVSHVDAGGDGSFSYDSTSGVFTYTGPSAAEARAHFGANFASGDGDFTYDSATGVFTMTGPSAAETRAHFSSSFAGGDGDFTYDSATGVFTMTGPSAAETRAHFSSNFAGGDGDFAYDSATGVFTMTGPSAAETRAHFSAVFASGDGDFAYDSATGVFTVTGPSASETRAHFSATGDLSYNSSTGVIDFSMSNHDTGDLAEGTNLYYTDTRVRNAISLTSDDSTVLAYDATTGAFTFDLGNTNTDKVAEGAGNLYFTTARARNSISAGANISYDASTGVISSSAAVDSVNGQTGVVVLDTDDIAEGSANLYYTDARARAAISLTSDDANILAYNSGTGVLTFVTPDTDSIDEGAVNLYYTDARADGRIAVASIRDLADVDSVASLNDGFTLVWSSSAQKFVPQNVTTATTTQNFTANGTDTSFALGFEVVGIENTTVFINGLYQAPTYSYTISTANGDTSIVFDAAPEANDVITVRTVSGATLNAQGVLNEDSTVDGGSF